MVQSPRSTSVTRRAAGLPMLILCVLSAGEAGKAGKGWKALLAQSVETLLDTARRPLQYNWDQTVDLPQVCRHRDSQKGSKKKTNCSLTLSGRPRRRVLFTFSRPWSEVPIWLLLSFSSLPLSPCCPSLCSAPPAGRCGTLPCNYSVSPSASTAGVTNVAPKDYMSSLQACLKNGTTQWDVSKIQFYPTSKSQC